MADKDSTDSGSWVPKLLIGLLGIMFVTLKLCEVIDWSWLWVTLPFWFWVPIAIASCTGLFLYWGFLKINGAVLNYRESKKKPRRNKRRAGE